MKREEIVAEVARAICHADSQDGWHCTEARTKCIRKVYGLPCEFLPAAEAAVSLCFARAADWCAIHTRRQRQFLADDFRALAHQDGHPAHSTQASASATPAANPASEARLSSRDT